MNQDKHIDESWKDSVSKEKEEIIIGKSNLEQSSDAGASGEEEMDYGEFNFISYISSLAFQSMIFLGEFPNPVDNRIERDLRKAKLIIDTLVILREKTTGNLSKEEGDMLNGAIYELQLKYVELFNQNQNGKQ